MANWQSAYNKHLTLNFSNIVLIWICVNSTWHSCILQIFTVTCINHVLPGITMVCWDPESALNDNLPPLASLSHSKVMCFFSLVVSFGMLSWLVRFKACSLELLDRHVRKRWDSAASTVSSQPYRKGEEKTTVSL